MLSTSISTKLDNNVHENQKPGVQNVEEDQGPELEQPKVDKVEKDQACVPSNKHKNNKDGAAISPTKNNTDTIDKEGKSRENVVKEAITYPISETKIFTQLKKQRNHKHPKKKSIPPKTIKLKHLTQQINQGLLQELIYLIKVSKYKNCHKQILTGTI